MVPSERLDCLIVGGGPVGLLAGYWLHTKGFKVAIYERQAVPYALPRAVMFDHESRRIFDSAGLGERILPVLQDLAELETRSFAWRDASGDVITAMEWKEAQSGYQAAMGFSQPQLEQVLRDALRDSGCPIIRSKDLEALVPHGDGMKATFKPWRSPGTPPASGSDSDGSIGEDRSFVSASFVIGCDGANSTVRELMGFEVVDRGFHYDWLVIDLLLKDKGLPPRMDAIFCSQICDPARPTTLAMSGNGRHRLEFMRLPGETQEELKSKASGLAAEWGVTDEYATIERVAIYTFRARWAETPVRGRVILAGDAAHQLPPFIGQGLNAGFRDIAALVWRLELIRNGVATARILDSFAHERAFHVKEVIDLCIELGQPICETDPEKSAIFHKMLRQTPSRPPVLQRLGVPSEGLYQDHAGAGYLSLQRKVTVGSRTALFDATFGFGWILVSFKAEPVLAAADRTFLENTLRGKTVVLDCVTDSTGEYEKYFTSLGVDTVLVRPDFYVFAIGAASESGQMVQLARSMLSQ